MNMPKYLFVFAALCALNVLAKPKLPAELSENVYSNVRYCLDYAYSNEEAKLYVEAVRGYTGALANLTPLAAELAKKKEKTTSEREKLTKLNKLLSEWRYKLEELEQPAQLEAYETLRSDYNYRLLFLKEALRTVSPIVIQTNFYSCFAAYKRALKQKELAKLADKYPDSLDPYYLEMNSRLSLLMGKKGELAGFNTFAAAALSELADGTNLSKHIELISSTLGGARPGLDGATLDSCYACLLNELPLCYTYWEAWGDLRLRRGDTNGAMRVWKKALTRFPKDFDLRFLLAHYAPATPEGAREAVEYLKDCLEMSSGSAASRISLLMAKRYTQIGEYGEAYAASQDAAKLARLSRSPTSDKEYRDARLFAADLALNYGLLDAALENLEKLTINDVWDIEIAEKLAKVRYAQFMADPMNKELLQDAVKAFDKFGAFRPGQKGICAAKAVMYLRAGMPREAQTQAMRELRVDQNDASALTVVGFVALEEGRKEEARASFEAALRSDPDYAKAKEGLELLR